MTRADSTEERAARRAAHVRGISAFVRDEVPGRGVLAVARKVAALLHRLWMSGEVYECGWKDGGRVLVRSRETTVVIGDSMSRD